MYQQLGHFFFLSKFKELFFSKNFVVEEKIFLRKSDQYAQFEKEDLFKAISGTLWRSLKYNKMHFSR